MQKPYAANVQGWPMECFDFGMRKERHGSFDSQANYNIQPVKNGLKYNLK
jgi:hypothetical protein